MDRRGELMRELFLELKRLGGRARPGALFEAVSTRVKFTPYEEARVKSGGIRWQVHIRFYTMGCVRAGFIQKSGGYWTLLPEGEKALSVTGGELIRIAVQKYREWRRSHPAEEEKDIESGEVPPVVERQAIYETAVEQARTEIEEHINALGPYEFQHAVAELLIAMGYHVPHVAQPGRDGGIDVVAYRDPLGTSTPRIKVQVKHRDQKVTVKEVRELEGLLRKDGDIGLIVSSGGFTSEVEREIRASTKHIEMMDLERFINLWQQHYETLREAGKSLLPLVKVFFLAPAEE
jgi:restriction system protein